MKRLAILMLALGLAGTTHAEGLTDLSEQDRAALHAEIRAYILENPEIILEAVDLLDAKREAMAATEGAELVSDNAEAIFGDGYSYVGGNPDGAITVVEFLDYQCGYCKRAHPEMTALIAGNPDVRFIVKEFPILGPESMAASRAAMAILSSHGPDAYKSFHDGLMEFEGRLSTEAIAQIASVAGIDLTKLQDRIDSDEISTMIALNRDLAQALAVTGTPTIIIGNEIIRGYRPLDGMQEVLDAEREKL